ncbi:MAG: hypothetical protein J4F49_10780 [Rhodobacteraceae bacterium]|nr:hypothetical protein [Paracoccaceae bacterium]
MQNEFKDNKRGNAPQEASRPVFQTEGEQGALKLMDRFFGSGEDLGREEAVASEGSEFGKYVLSRKSGSNGPAGGRKTSHKTEKTIKAHQAGSSADGGEAAIGEAATGKASCEPETVRNVASEVSRKDLHEFEDQPAKAGAVAPDRSVEGGAAMPQRSTGLDIVHPDDPDFLDEFGAVEESEDEQGIFDWFALESRDPLDVDDNMLSDAAELPEMPVDKVDVRRQGYEVAADRRVAQARAVERKGRISVSGTEQEVRRNRFGNEGSGEVGKAQTVLADDSDGPGCETNSSGKMPDSGAGRNGTGGEAPGGGVFGGRKFGIGRSRRGIVVLAMAAVGGIAMMQSTGNDSVMRSFETAVSGITDALSGNFPGPTRDAPLTDHSLAGGEWVAGSGTQPATEIDREFDAMPMTPKQVLAEDEGRFRLQLVPVDASEIAEWDRLFALLEQPVINAPPTHAGSDSGFRYAENLPARAEEALPGHSTRRVADFTADDGFALDDIAAAVQLQSSGQNTGYTGLGLPFPGAAQQANMIPEDSAQMSGAPSGVNSVTSEQGEMIAEFRDVADRVGKLEERLAEFDGQFDRLHAQVSAAIVRQVGFGSRRLSPFSTPAGLARDFEGGVGIAESNHVIIAGMGGLTPATSFAGIEVGDRVDGFGKVLEIADYDDGGTLFVMEGGTVYLN